LVPLRIISGTYGGGHHQAKESRCWNRQLPKRINEARLVWSFKIQGLVRRGKGLSKAGSRGR